MKPNFIHSFAGRSNTLRALCLTSAGSALICAAFSEEAPTPGNNWITLEMGGSSIHGDREGFQRRANQNGDFYGGIESMGYTQDINDSTVLTVEGHALPGREDYGGEIELKKEGLGYVKTGYKQFRTWYDATGGYLQGANMAASNVYGLFDEERYIDRGEFFIEGGLRQEDFPEITFAYRHQFREGQKDSTSWGDSLANTNWAGTSSPAFKFMPSLLGIDESTDIIELDIDHTIGNTELGAGLVFEHYDLDNSRYTPRNGNIPTGVNGNTTAGIANINLNEKTTSDMLSSHIYSVTRFSDKAWLSYAASYSNMNTDIDGGSRSYGVYFPNAWLIANPSPPASGGNVKRDYAYDQMTGGSNVNQFVTNLNFMWVPIEDLTVTPSLRYEKESVDTISSFRAFNSNTTWYGVQQLGAFSDLDSITSAIDLRYTGVENFVFFGKALAGTEAEDVLRQDLVLPGELLSTKIDVNESEGLLGVNWYAARHLSFSLQGFHNERKQSLDHNLGDQAKVGNTNPGGANNFRPIMTEHNVEMDDVNLRMTWKPVYNVSLVSRYDYQKSTIENQGLNWSPPAGPVLFNKVESGHMQTHILSQNITWNPIETLYFQGDVSWARSQTTTPEQYTGDSDNDYLVSSLTAGYALDEKTELTVTYSYFVAENYGNSTAFTGVNTMGYGGNTKEHSISLMLTRELTPNMVWNVRYAFLTSNTDPGTDQTGGLNDFDAHMISSGLQVRF